jgi:hypothetical protein
MTVDKAMLRIRDLLPPVEFQTIDEATDSTGAPQLPLQEDCDLAVEAGISNCVLEPIGAEPPKAKLQSVLGPL